MTGPLWGKRIVAFLVALLLSVTGLALSSARASTPDHTDLSGPADEAGVEHTQTAAFGGTLVATGDVDPTVPCTPVNCDTHTINLTVPADYWENHRGDIKVQVGWTDNTGVSDLDVYVVDKDGRTVGSSASSDNPEIVDLHQLKPGSYTVQVLSFAAEPAVSYTGRITFASTYLTPASKAMQLPEDKNTLMDELTVHYPLRVIFVGRTPTPAEVAELRSEIPDTYQPTVSTKSDSPTGDPSPAGAGDLINWNKVHYAPGQQPYFEGFRYQYDLQILTASEAYTKALFQVAKEHTAQDQSYQSAAMTAQQVNYDSTYGHFRMAAKGGDPSYKVTNPAVEDLIDSYAVEDWMFASRTDPAWQCAFTDLETHACVGASALQDTAGSYHDPYYDKFGLNLDTMPQGVNKGSSVLFFDTFSPSYAKDYFRPDAYHVWGTDKVIDGKIIPKDVAHGGSWRITDPDVTCTNPTRVSGCSNWAGVDFGRTWGGRYRWHFFDLGAAPNTYEDVTWANYGAVSSAAYPQGDPPVWQYDADPEWNQDQCQVTGQTAYTGDTPCRMIPRLARDVAYDLFFRSTPGYLYRPIPRGDVYWLATTNFTDFYSRPQWDPKTGAPFPVGSPYGTWWSDLSKLYQVDDVNASSHDDTLRWLSSATPYTRWVGRRGEVIPLYDPATNKPTGKTLDTSPKYADLPAPEYRLQSTATGQQLVPEPLYGGHHEVMTNADGSQVDLTQFSNEIEKAKAEGIAGAAYDDSVNPDTIRDYVDAHRTGLADQVTGVGTIPSVNIVFEKAFTWALPAIVGGIAVATADGESWGVLNNVNDRFKTCDANYPVYDPTQNHVGDKVSLAPCHAKQESGTGFSYTIEHEAAHSLGLSHPHDGSYGVDKCPAGDPNAGKWACYWSGLGWVMDISAAPTTYASDYRPYEVEDQDQLQRGHIAEYLLGGMTSLQTELAAEAAQGRTTPSNVFQSRYSAFGTWKAQAVSLFRAGDYLHGEYAARNAALAAKGVVQTGANTVDPRLLGAGQVYYFNVHPQATTPIRFAKPVHTPAAQPMPNLRVTRIASVKVRKGVTRLVARVTNTGAADASGVVVRFRVGRHVVRFTAPVTVSAGGQRVVSLTWRSKRYAGKHRVVALVDPTNQVIESVETDNALSRRLRIH